MRRLRATRMRNSRLGFFQQRFSARSDGASESSRLELRGHATKCRAGSAERVSPPVARIDPRYYNAGVKGHSVGDPVKRAMARRHDIDRVLQEWPYQPGEISARLVRAADGREVVQMRVEMGLLQLETDGRPDGTRPSGS